MKTGVVSSFFQKYTMILALIVVVIFFAFTTDGKILYAQNINNLISQNAYVFVLATGMLMCILTGGNIDLAVGSVVCFAGGVGAVMLKSGLNVWIAVLAMLVIGLLIGYFQGFWIAWISVPPFIATLAGMYAFRGLSNVVLNGYAVAINDKVFLNVFGGGADCYVPDFFKVESVALNATCLIGGAIVALIYLATTISGVIKEKKLGIASENPAIKLVKAVVICIIIMVFAYILASYKGIPSGLVWIAAVMLIYNYLLNNTAIGKALPDVLEFKIMLTDILSRMQQMIGDVRSKGQKSFVLKAQEYVAAHYNEEGITIEKICKNLGVSSAYFSTVFKKETGKTFVTYLTDYRMDKAKEILMTSDKKTYVIAAEVGFTDPNYFSYVFKRQYGITPSKFRTRGEIS